MRTEGKKAGEIKVFFCTNTWGNFTERDIGLLRKEFRVQVYFYTGLKKLPLHLVNIFVGVRRNHISFCNFADNHTLLTLLISKLLRKKTLVIIGGYEVGRIDGLKYGLNRSLFFPAVVRFILKHADHLLPVSDNLVQDAKDTIGSITNNITVIPNGFDSHLYTAPTGDKKNEVLCVALCKDFTIYRLKGIDQLIQTAAITSEIPYIIVGIHDELIKKIKLHSPSNVDFRSALPQKELISLYQQAKVYCQLSLREGHPNALCEAMLCECVPVGADVPGIRQVIGDTGYLVNPSIPENIAKAIKQALKAQIGSQARQKIQENYSLHQREEAFKKIIMSSIQS
ncbi:MAG: glycosyltransferase [Acidobacteriota bacterium]